MNGLVVGDWGGRHDRREAIKYALVNDGADGSEWAINLIEKQITGSDLLLKVNHKIMAAFLDSCRASLKSISKRILASEHQMEQWRSEDTEIELWRLKVLGTYSRKYNWLAFFLDDERKLP